MSYTPGPWRVIPEHEMVVGAGDATVVYELNTNEDDARLIAAAPELLLALDAAKWMLERDYIDDQKMAVIRKCEEAIAKATGDES